MWKALMAELTSIPSRFTCPISRRIRSARYENEESQAAGQEPQTD
jgi:hypothetical protein